MEKQFFKSLEKKLEKQLQIFPLVDDKYYLITTLGEGRFGKVKLGFDKLRKEFVAIKILKKNSSLICFSQFFNEIKTLIDLGDSKKISNIKEFNFEGVLEKSKKRYHILYYASKICLMGEVFDFLEHLKNLDLSVKVFLMFEILKAIRIVFDKKILHGDLKPENLLLNSKFKVKICDFGTAINFQDISESRKICTEKYCAPEILRNQKKNVEDPRKFDIFSIGVIFHIILINSFPSKTLDCFKNFKTQEIEDEKLLDDIKETILEMLEKDVDKRINFETIFEKFKFFAKSKKINNFDIFKKEFFNAKTSQILRKIDQKIKKEIYNIKINRHIKEDNTLKKYYENKNELEKFFREYNSLIKNLAIIKKKKFC